MTATITAEDAGANHAIVESSLGGDKLVAPGDVVVLDDFLLPPGTNQLVAVHRFADEAGTLVGWRVPRRHARRECGDPAFGMPIERAEIVAALLSTDCKASLAAKDPRYLESVCAGDSDRTHPGVTDGANGCSHADGSVTMGSAPMMFALIAGAAWARRRWRLG